LDEAAGGGYSGEAIADQIRTLGTTILYMPNRSEAVEQSFRNRTGLAQYLDYRGVEVISAYGPVEVAGLRWAISSKQDLAEALAPAFRLKRDLLAAAAATAIALTFLALACAGLFMRPLRRVVLGMKAARSTVMIQIAALRSRLEKQPTDLRRSSRDFRRRYTMCSQSRLRPWSTLWTTAGWLRATSAPLPKHGIRLSCR
jgi:hypothetical protein